MQAAIRLRASSSTSLACCPNSYQLEGLPQVLRAQLVRACKAASLKGVVAALSA